MRVFLSRVRVIAALFAVISSQAIAADGESWSVSKSSGDVWLNNDNAQPISLKSDASLKPGDTVSTGRNGRVLLVRGEEKIMISPNSVVGIPTVNTEGLSTTIVQKAGSVLLDVEKRNVKHFEVETPYLAAVVKGTQFRVTVNANNTTVDVMRGQVEVADFKTGQIAQVMPGQKATAFEHGKAGLVLNGSGVLNPIEQGKPRTPSFDRVHIPKAGLSALRNASDGDRAKGLRAAAHSDGAMTRTQHGVRISSALGDVKVNFHKVTHGLARDAAASNSAGGNRNSNSGTGGDSSAPSGPSPVSGTGGNGPVGGVASGNNGSGGDSSASSSSTVRGVASGGNSLVGGLSSSVSAVATGGDNLIGNLLGNGQGNGANGNGKARGHSK